MAKNKQDERTIQQISLQELKQLVQKMKPSGKVNDIYAIRLFLLSIISRLEDKNK